MKIITKFCTFTSLILTSSLPMIYLNSERNEKDFIHNSNTNVDFNQEFNYRQKEMTWDSNRKNTLDMQEEQRAIKQSNERYETLHAQNRNMIMRDREMFNDGYDENERYNNQLLKSIQTKENQNQEAVRSRDRSISQEAYMSGYDRTSNDQNESMREKFSDYNNIPQIKNYHQDKGNVK